MNGCPRVSKRQEYLKQGYVVLKNVIEHRDIQDLGQVFDHYFTVGMEFPRDNLTDFYKHSIDAGVLYDVHFRYPEFRQVIERREIVDALVDILDCEDLVILESSALTKKAGFANKVPMHQDFLDDPDGLCQKAIVWIPLDDVGSSDGCLRIFPTFSNKKFPWKTLQGGATHHKELVDAAAFETEARDLLLSAGDVLIFSNLLVHGSAEAASDEGRRTLRFAIKTGETPYVPRGCPVVLSRKKHKYVASLFDKALNPRFGWKQKAMCAAYEIARSIKKFIKN